MMKVYITRVIPEQGLKVLKDAGFEVDQYTAKEELTQQDLLKKVRGYDALISVGPNKIDEYFLQETTHLKAISLLSAGFDNVDVSAANKLNIPVGHTPGVLSGATADTAFLLMLSVSRKAFYLHKSIAKGEWGFYEPTANLGVELNGKTLGIFGLGKIGFELARKCAAAFGMKIIYHNRGRAEEAENKLDAVRVSFEELLEQSDVLSVHTVLSQDTRGIFDAQAFARMKSSAIFINTARGAIHKQSDLKAALEQKIIWGAGLDVTDPEPMAKDDPLLDMPNVCILPHIGSATTETRNAMSVIAANNIVAGCKGLEMPHAANPEVYRQKG